MNSLLVLRDRRFALLLAARTISVLGAAFAPVALAFGVLQLPGATPTWLSVVLACQSVPLVVFTLAGGILADRYRRTRVMLLAESLSLLCYLALGALMIVGFTPLWALGAVAALSGTAMALLYPALTGVIPEILPRHHLQSGNSLLSFGRSLAQILGVLVAGGAVTLLGGARAMLITAGFFAVAAVLTWLLGPSARPDRSQATSLLADLRDGWGEFRRREWLWVIVAQWALLMFCFEGAHGVIGPVIAEARLGGAGPWSLILLGEGVGMAIGVAVTMLWRPRRPILVAVVATGVTLPVPFALLGLEAPLWSVIVSAVVGGACMSVFGVLWSTTMQREVPPAALARVASYDALGSYLFGPLGLLVAGPLVTLIGADPAMVGCAAALLLIGVIPVISRDVRTLEWSADDAA